jgi:hypothetical protein
MALSASIDDKTNIACFGLRALGLFARARADDPLSKHPHIEMYCVHTVKARKFWSLLEPQMQVIPIQIELLSDYPTAEE